MYTFVEEVIRSIIIKAAETKADLSDIQLVPGKVPYIRGFLSKNFNTVIRPGSSDTTMPAFDVNAFYPVMAIDGARVIEEKDISDFLFSYINDQQSQVLTQERQLSFRMELTKEDGSLLSAFRATAYYQRDKLSLALRILKTNILTPEQLHLHPLLYTNYIANNTGLVIISGPAGAGKTTTAVSLLKYKLLSYKKRGALHLITIESPVEYEISVGPEEGIVEQREVGIDTPDYPTATRDIVRINPNIIFVGEVRDSETAINCLQMATTGHLVLTTFHANSVKEVIARFRSFLKTGEDINMLTNSLVAVTNQRLYTFKTLNGLSVFPVIEAIKGNEATRKLILDNRIEEIPSYMNERNESISSTMSINYIKQLIDKEEEHELIRKPPNPPVSTDF